MVGKTEPNTVETVSPQLLYLAILPSSKALFISGVFKYSFEDIYECLYSNILLYLGSGIYSQKIV